MKISVIIPTYNGEKTIERAIKSVSNQTANCEFEILICDDASSDRTVEIAKRYGCVIIRNTVNSGGANRGRNNGIRRASGQYIAFLDQDDEWLPFKIESQLIEINNGYEFIYSRGIKKEKQRS